MVVCGDSDLRGFDRYVTALRSFAPDRRRWWVRYHLGANGFRARSQRAERIVGQQRERPDVILQIGATFRLTPRSGIPYVLYCDSNIELARQGVTSGHSDAAMLAAEELEAIREREALVYAGAARIFTTSDRLRRVFIEHFDLDERRVETVHAGPNFPYGESPRVPERSLNGPPVVLFVGKAFHRKGGDLLLEAFRTVRRSIPDARLIILGPDVIPPGVASAPGVEFVGFVNKATPEGQARINEAYASARVFCLPTRFEPFGVVFLEAMHYALPVVAPRAWAVPTNCAPRCE